MFFGIRMLDILKNEVEFSDDFSINFRRGESGSFNGAVNLFRSKTVKDIGQKIRLKKGFSARESHAAPEFGKDIGMSQKLFGQIFVSPNPAGDSSTGIDADGNAFSAGITNRFLTDLLAGAAMTTLMLVDQKLNFWGNTFRIMAPGAVQGTTFHEDGRSHSRTVEK